MDNNISNINVEQIMEQIRADIKERGFKDSDIDFESVTSFDDDVTYSIERYNNVVTAAGLKRYVASYRPLSGNIIGRFIKKIIRRMVAFYIESIVDDQNGFNECIYESIKLNRSKLEQDTYAIKALEKRLEECEERISELEKELGGKKN